MARRTRPEQEAELRIYQVQWTDEALDTFENAYAWLAESSEEKADLLYEELLERTAQLAEHPFLGPVPSELSTSQAALPFDLLDYLRDKRQLVISKSHRVIYRVNEEAGIIFILLIHPTRLSLLRLLQESE